MMREFLGGLGAPFRAIGLLSRVPRLRRLAMLPLLVNIVLFAIGVPLAVWGAVVLMGSVLPSQGAFQDLLRLFLQVTVAVAVMVASLFLFVIVGNVVAAPFNSALSEAIEAHLNGSPVVGGLGAFSGAVRGVRTALARLLLFLLFYPLIFAVQLVPVIGPVLHPILAILYGAFVLSLDFSDPTFERHLPRFRDRVGYIRRHKARYLGFGLTAVAMALVPIINFLLLPVGVAGAAMLYLESEGAVAKARGDTTDS